MILLKNPKNLNVKQKKFLKSKKLDPKNWRVIKHTPTEMLIINKLSNKTREIKL